MPIRKGMKLKKNLLPKHSSCGHVGLPDTETTTPNKTSKIAGSFSRLNKELGSSFIKIKPGRM